MTFFWVFVFQGFINSSFENITSTDHALNLLRQFQAILQRESLKADLNAKYMVIFQNYGLDVDAVQKLYETNKANPPVVRNAPPVAGNIMWSRQLLQRIEKPMKTLSDNKIIMSTKESRRIVKTYNKVRSWHITPSCLRSVNIMSLSEETTASNEF